MKKAVLSFLVLLLASVVTASAANVYWSFNNQDLSPDFGVGTLSITTFSIGTITTEDWGTGTSVGAVDSTPPGYSANFEFAADAIEVIRFEMSNLNFSGQSDIVLTFAIRSDELFDVGESLSVSYDTGSGFTGAQVLTNPGNGWSLRTVNFGSALNGVANAKIRIDTSAAMDVGKDIEFDNIHVVPEPSPLAFMALGAVLTAVVIFRRKFRKA